ncbi:MAG: SDR family oxidoreductase, partial [Solirubrobacteraceae bacterium]
MTDTILVIGATGTTGRRLSTRLAARGITVRAAGRQPGDGRTPFDWNRPETHGPALAGVDAVYLIPPSFVEDPTDMTGPFLGRAQQAGVSKVVALSSLGAVF